VVSSFLELRLAVRVNCLRPFSKTEFNTSILPDLAEVAYWDRLSGPINPETNIRTIGLAPRLLSEQRFLELAKDWYLARGIPFGLVRVESNHIVQEIYLRPFDVTNFTASHRCVIADR
jgi:hypothetical protein